MNILNIDNKKDYLRGLSSVSQSIDINENFCALNFTCNFIKNISIEDLEEPLLNLISKNNFTGCLFYLWFDEQAVQLRFNIIPYEESVSVAEQLPFDCSVAIKESLQPVLGDCLNSMKDFYEGNDDVEYTNDCISDEPEGVYVLDVYIKKI